MISDDRGRLLMLSHQVQVDALTPDEWRELGLLVDAARAELWGDALVDDAPAMDVQDLRRMVALASDGGLFGLVPTERTELFDLLFKALLILEAKA